MCENRLLDGQINTHTLKKAKFRCILSNTFKDLLHWIFVELPILDGPSPF